MALIAKACEDGFVSIKDGVRFVRERFGIEYTESGMTKVFSVLQSRKKVPRPDNAKMPKQRRKPRRATKKGVNPNLKRLELGDDVRNSAFDLLWRCDASWFAQPTSAAVVSTRLGVTSWCSRSR